MKVAVVEFVAEVEAGLGKKAALRNSSEDSLGWNGHRGVSKCDPVVAEEVVEERHRYSCDDAQYHCAMLLERLVSLLTLSGSLFEAQDAPCCHHS